MPDIRLCLASPTFFPHPGGAELRFRRYLPRLAQLGVESRIVTGTPKQAKLAAADRAADWYRLRPGALVPAEPLDGIPVQRVRLPDKTGWHRSFVFNQAVLRSCRQHEPRPDVVQLLAPMHPRSWPWLLRLRSLGIATVYAYTLATKWPANPVERAIHRASLRRLYQSLDCVVTNSAALRDIVLGLGVTTRVEVIPNGVDLRVFSPARFAEERRALRAELGIDAEDSVITTVGSISPRKGSDLMLEAWARLAPRFPRAHLLLVGARRDLDDPGMRHFRRRLEEFVAASGAPERVHFTGLVDNVDAILRASDVFVHPSRREGLPNAVLEAMATAVPVVMTPFIGGREELGRPCEHYLPAEHTPQSLAAAIEKLLLDSGLRAGLGEQGRRWVEETMDLKSSLDRYASLYRALGEHASTCLSD
jgi:glycosyltransferase involved in cell wall biosynthesis